MRGAGGGDSVHTHGALGEPRSCSYLGLPTQRERMAGPFEEMVKATIKDLDRREWGHREEVAAAFRRTQAGKWVAPAGLAGKGGPMDGTVINPWYGLFPQEWVNGSSTGEGDGHRSGELWKKHRRSFKRLGDCCIRMCADLWTAPDRPG